MTIKVVKPRVDGAGADSVGRTTETIISRLGAIRKRSQQLLNDMTDLQAQLRQHSERNDHTSPPPGTATPNS